MNIIVCVKQVHDPEAPPESFKIDSERNTMVRSPGVLPVISAFDECALEAALRVKDVLGGKITVLTVGENLVRDVAKKPLAMGADRLILLEDSAFAGGDTWSTAYALSKAVEKIGAYDLILCGRQSADWDGGQVGLGVAELLGIPSINVAKRVDIVQGKARAERITADGYEIVEATLPALITISSELGQPRYPTIAGIMTAKKKEITHWKPWDIGVEASQVGAAGRRMKLVKLSQPVREGNCEMIWADSPEEAGATLAMKLREAKIL